MVVLELDKIEIDYCTSCKGIWLDAGELELLLEDSARKDKFLASFTADKKLKEELRKCPICLKKMEKVLCGLKERVRIDRCINNDGIWFDSGELERVIKMGSFDENNKVLSLLKNIFSDKKEV